jgi:DNA-directed RNA polymerase alpha subunit
MIKISKVNLSIIENHEEIGNSNLTFKISGSNIDYIVVNTLRRTIFSDIPIYAFNTFIRYIILVIS